MGQIVIYGLHRPGRDIFYVGKTNSLKRRLKEHRRWLKGKIEAIVLEIVESSEWKAAEHAWIQTFRDLGLTMANKTEGGDGAETLSAELKAAISARQTGRKASEETRKRMSAAGKGKRKNWTLDGLGRAAATRIQPGTKPWNTFTPDMTEAEKEAIRQRIVANRNDDSIERMRRGSRKANESWSNYSPGQRAARGAHISEALQKSDALKAQNARRAPEVSIQMKSWWSSLAPQERADFIARRAEKRQTATQKR